MDKEIKIFLADDHPVFREGLIKIIQTEENFKVVYSSGNGTEALEFIQKNKPDIAILDISMPGKTGIEIAKAILEEELETLPVILTMYNDVEYLEEAMEYGVRGYLLKDSTALEIVNCLKAVLDGAFYISGEITDNIIKNRKNKSSKNEIEEKLKLLTHSEKHIIKLLSENKTSQQIAKELFLSHRTIQNHRHNISHKLGLNGHNKLLLFAIEHKALL